MIRKLFITTIISIVSFHFAAASSFNDTLIGTWRGTSGCQVKNSPCHDEIVVYHITKGDKPGTYHFIANKMVNGKEEDMGEMDYTFDPAAGTLTSIDEARKAVWKFKIKGKTMEGTLIYKNELYRIIKLNKDK